MLDHAAGLCGSHLHLSLTCQILGEDLSWTQRVCTLPSMVVHSIDAAWYLLQSTVNVSAIACPGFISVFLKCSLQSWALLSEAAAIVSTDCPLLFCVLRCSLGCCCVLQANWHWPPALFSSSNLPEPVTPNRLRGCGAEHRSFRIPPCFCKMNSTIIAAI